jgi:hypothetical protein
MSSFTQQQQQSQQHQHQQSQQHQHQQHADECAICMEELDSVKNFAKTNCGHSFCLSCLVKSLKNNNTCPMCRTNIEEKKPENPNVITLEDCVDLIKEEMEMFPYREHLDAITMFDNPVSSLKSMLRVFGLGLSKNIIAFQTEELEEEIYDDEEEEDAEEEEEEEENMGTVSDEE